VEVYAQPRLDDMELEPLVLNFVIPLPPTVKLGDYRALRKEVEPVTVTDEALEAALEHVRTHHEVLEDVDRPVEVGDKVTVSGKGQLGPSAKEEEEETEAETAVEPTEAVEAEETADTPDTDEGDGLENDGLEDDGLEADAVIFDQENVALIMDGDTLFFGHDFVNNVVGMNVGEEKTFTITFPDDFDDEEYAGREATFTLSVLNVQKRTLPELDDELAQKEGNYETLDELREMLRKELQEQGESQAKDELVEGMIDDLLTEAEMVYPPAAIDAEIDDMLVTFKNQVERSGWQWEDFMTMQGQDEDDMREQFRETAATRLKRQLALRQFILEEKLRIKAADIDAALDEKVARFDNEELRIGMRDYYRQGPAFEMLSSEILMDKAYERMQAVLTGTAPDLDALADEDEETAVDEEE
jgi:trigger factor